MGGHGPFCGQFQRQKEMGCPGVIMIMKTASAISSAPPLQLSVLDIGVLQLSVRLAPRVEALGYQRYWLSEHHGESAISNPTLLVPVIAGLTDTIRVGTAGVLLRFQSPVSVAENFRALNRLFPGRIDAGMARAGASAALGVALADGRPEQYSAADHAARVLEVQRLLSGRLPPDHPLVGYRIDPPLTVAGPPALWVHSTSPEGARLAASIGCHYAFHDHFNRRVGPASVRQYIDEFRASPELERPVWATCVTGYCAENDADARRVQARMLRGVPVENPVIVGTMNYWRDQLAGLSQAYQSAEFIVQTFGGKYDLEEQVDSFARIAEVARSLRVAATPS
jgi:luciferase family oxidoreductase group 1